jgi:hypothetical protein
MGRATSAANLAAKSRRSLLVVVRLPFRTARIMAPKSRGLVAKQGSADFVKAICVVRGAREHKGTTARVQVFENLHPSNSAIMRQPSTPGPVGVRIETPRPARRRRRLRQYSAKNLRRFSANL